MILALAISESQAFIDGNKRTAHVAMHSFLIGNGFEARAPQQQYADWILRLATGTNPEQIADELRRVLVPAG